MFGYVIINQQEMKLKDYEKYRSYYCGLCQSLKKRYGLSGQVSLTYDMTFLILLLTALYEPQTVTSACTCIAHPFEKHKTRVNVYTDYAADLNLLLTYEKCMDDWQDERKLLKRGYAGILLPKVKRIAEKYPKKAAGIREELKKIQEMEQRREPDIDIPAGAFGRIMEEIFAFRADEWEKDLREMGFFLGKFIYLMDAYLDMKKDQKSGNYNPFLLRKQPVGAEAERILLMMMAACSKAFERLPIVEDAEILRNILYSGVWCRYHAAKNGDQNK